MWRRIWQFLLPIHHDVSGDRAWLPYREPCVSCQHRESFFYWNTTTRKNSSTDGLCKGKMWQSNVKNIFHISCWPFGVSTRPKHMVRWYEEFPGLRNHLPHLPAYSRQSERQNFIARMHTWQQCSVSTLETISTTKYGFNLRQNSPLNIEHNTGYSGWISVSVAYALIGPPSLKLAHFWSDIRWFPPLLFHYIPLHDLKRAGETVLNATVPTSPPGDQSQGGIPGTLVTALKIAPT